MFFCEKCQTSFTKHKSLIIHKVKCKISKCNICKAIFRVKKEYLNHLLSCKTQNDCFERIARLSSFNLHKKAYKNILGIYNKVGVWPSLENLFASENSEIIKLLTGLLKELGSIKMQICIQLRFIKQKPNDIVDSTEIYKISMMESVTHSSHLEAIIKKAENHLELVIDQFTQRGSGWVLQSIKLLEVRVCKLKENSGGCHGSSADLPSKYYKKKSLISPICRTECFKWAVLIGLHERPINRARISAYRVFENLYNFNDMDEETPFSKIALFEKRNNISINVYTLTDAKPEKVVPLKINKVRKDKHVNLLLFNDHYYCITNFNAFVGDKSNWERYYCYSCLSGFRTLMALESHEKYCIMNAAQKVVLPGETKTKTGEPNPRDSTTCEFRSFDKMIAYPYVVYADFESLPAKSEQALTANTFEYQRHQACSFGLIVIDWNDRIIFQKFYRGENVADKFMECLLHIQPMLRRHFALSYQPAKLSAEEKQSYANAKTCYVCSKGLADDKVLDHCHLTGKFRGAAHNHCNLAMKMPTKLPILFHNLKGYDAHLLISGLKSNYITKIHVIPQNIEKYIAIIINDDFLFLDSLAFLLSSLDTLANNTPTECKTKILGQIFREIDIPLLLNKGCLPYEYIDSWDKFEERNLPPIECFYSHLTKKTVSEATYHRLEKIWNNFECSTLGEFHDIYLKVDVGLLASVFQNFRSTSLKQFGLDPCHYFSTPGLTWDAALKSTKVKLDLLTDIDMVLMVERGIRGGISCAMTRHAVANNQRSQNYDPNSPSSFITYLDVNNLYGYALSDTLPVSDFRWVEESCHNMVIEKILRGTQRPDEGFILEVDLEYPECLHDLHNDYPLAPEGVEINSEQLSPYQKELIGKLRESGIKRYATKKLIPNLMKKSCYVIHAKNLKFYLLKGLILTKVYRILSFIQKPWVKSYIDLCTTNRQKAASTFEKDFWKLMVNSLYGKSIEDKRKHTNVRIVTNGVQALQQIRKPMFDQFFILDNNLAIFKMRKFKVKLDKPIYLGFTVLELSKLHMYHLHYNIFKEKYKNRLSLVYTDTDSFIYHIYTDDFYNDLKELNYIMDFSDYPEDHFLHNTSNKKKLGYLKDEMNGTVIDEVIAIKSKLYAIKYGGIEKKTAKGVQRATVRDEINFEDYKNCLYDQRFFKHLNHRLQSKEHQISSIKTNKISLSPLDDKRYLLNDGIKSYAFGHYLTK